MNNEILFRGGSKQLEIDLLYGQYYVEIWGNVSAVNSTIHSGISLPFVGSSMIYDFAWQAHKFNPPRNHHIIC